MRSDRLLTRRGGEGTVVLSRGWCCLEEGAVWGGAVWWGVGGVAANNRKWHHNTLCEQNDWQTGVKTLPCPKLNVRMVIKWKWFEWIQKTLSFHHCLYSIPFTVWQHQLLYFKSIKFEGMYLFLPIISQSLRNTWSSSPTFKGAVPRSNSNFCKWIKQVILIKLQWQLVQWGRLPI